MAGQPDEGTWCRLQLDAAGRIVAADGPSPLGGPAVGATLRERVLPACRAHLDDGLARAARGETVSRALRVRATSGRAVWVTVQIAPRGGGWTVTCTETEAQRFANVEVRLLAHLLERTSGAVDAAEAVREALSGICLATGWTYGEAWLPSGDALERGPVWHALPELEEFARASLDLRFTAGEGLPGRVLVSGEVEWLPDVSRSEGFVRRELARRAGLRAAVGIPAASTGRVRAVLVFYLEQEQQQQRHLVELISAGAAQLALVLERLEGVARLRDSEERHATTLRSIGDAVLVTDLERRVTDMNDAAETLTGWRLDEARHRPLGEVFRIRHEETGEPAACPVDRALREGRVVGLANHTELVRRDGACFAIEDSAAPIRDTLGRITGVVLVFRDATRERRARRRLDRSQRELKALIEGLPDGLILHREGRIAYANPALARALGLEAAQLVGRHIRDLAHPDEQALEGETRFSRDDGSTLVLDLRPGGEVELDGAPASVLAARDVTDQRLLRARMVLADRMASLGTLAAGVAHEINNPLSYMLANVAFVREGLERWRAGDAPEPQWIPALEDAQLGIERARDIVRDLRRFSRDEGAALEPVDVRRTVTWAVRMTSAQVEQRARVVEELDDTPPVLAQESRLAQVVVNLIVNAAQAFEEPDPEANEVRLSLRRQGDRVRLEVRDNGPGIPEHLQQRIFDPFFTTKPVGEGTGLGLAICHSLVAGFGGRLAVDSRPGGGSAFWFELPIAAAPDTAAPPGAPEPPGPRRGHVLVVDDERLVGRSIERVLAGAHDVVVVTSGEEALERLRAASFDLVLCDVMMPRTTGIDLYRQVAAEMPGVEERMVFMTGAICSEEASRFLQSIDNPSYDKPIDTPTLRALVAARVGT